MLAVDEMIKQLVDSLQYSGKLENTYIFFTSDNGKTMGEHRRQKGKLSAYETDIRVPLIVRGPGVPEGAVREHLVLNNDFAPTFAELGGVSSPDPMSSKTSKLEGSRCTQAGLSVIAGSTSYATAPRKVAARQRGSSDYLLVSTRSDPGRCNPLLTSSP
jgi:arylsulfatase A-like enzyme